MKITRSEAIIPPYTILRCIQVGKTFQLRRRLSRDTDLADPFLMVDLQSYTLYSNQYECARLPSGKVAVLNLANNRLSYIDKDREALEIDTEVRILE